MSVPLDLFPSTARVTLANTLSIGGCDLVDLATERLVERLKACAVGKSAPAPGDPMPGFVLPDDRGKLVSLGSLLDRGPVAITFHRGHWCPYCRINTKALAEAQERIAAEGGQIVAIMPEKQEFATEWKDDIGIQFPILSDLDNGYALSLNLVYWMGDEMKGMLTEAGKNITMAQGNDTWFLPVPATFVVGTDGKVKARFVDPDYRKRMAIEDLMAALRSAG